MPKEKLIVSNREVYRTHNDRCVWGDMHDGDNLEAGDLVVVSGYFYVVYCVDLVARRIAIGTRFTEY